MRRSAARGSGTQRTRSLNHDVASMSKDDEQRGGVERYLKERFSSIEAVSFPKVHRVEAVSQEDVQALAGQAPVPCILRQHSPQAGCELGTARDVARAQCVPDRVELACVSSPIGVVRTTQGVVRQRSALSLQSTQRRHRTPSVRRSPMPFPCSPSSLVPLDLGRSWLAGCAARLDLVLSQDEAVVCLLRV